MSKNKWTRRGWWNYYFWQWLFIRRCIEDRPVNISMRRSTVSSRKDGRIEHYATEVFATEGIERREGWMLGAWPRSGWDDRPYRYIGGKALYRWGKWVDIGHTPMYTVSYESRGPWLVRWLDRTFIHKSVRKL